MSATNSQKSGTAGRPRSSHRRKRSHKIFLITLLCIVAIVAGAAYFLFLRPGAPKDSTIRIPADATEQTVRDTLMSRFGKDYTDEVMRFMGFFGFEPAKRHGAYFIARGTSPVRAARRLAKGGQTPVKVTLKGFRNREDLIRTIAAKFEFSPAELSEEFYNSERLSPLGLDRESAPVIVLNDTYEFYWTDSPKHLMDKIADNYSGFWNKERMSKAESMGLTPRDIYIIASIVEEETTIKDEMGTIGRLYVNRLQKGMRLQADPTIRFALGDFSIKRVAKEHLFIKSPYNTYRNNGLPPGPIRTVSGETIDAILNSKPSDYLFMCARPDFSGRHDFSTTFKEHHDNAEAYRAELDRRDIHNKK